MSSTPDTRPNLLVAAFANLNVKTKILLGFGLVLLVLAGVGGVSYRGQTQVAGGFASYARVVAVVNAVDDAYIDFVDIRRNAREFALTGREERMEQVRALAPKVRADIEHGLGLTVHPEWRRHLENMRDKLPAYLAVVAKVAELRQEQDKLIRETLDPSGLRMRTDLDHLVAEATQAGNTEAAFLGWSALEKTMLLRLSANKAMAQHTPEFYRATETAYAELAKSMAALDTASRNTSFRRDYEDVVKLASSYLSAFRQVETIGKDMARLIDEPMFKLGSEIAADAKFVNEAGTAEQHRLQEAASALTASTERLTALLSAAGLVLGLGLALLIGGMIARPMLALAAGMRRLADRDWSTPVGFQSRKDEIGGMARAVQVFKDNGIENDRLADAQKVEQVAKEKRVATIDALIASFESRTAGALETLASAAAELNATAGAMAGTAEETAAQVTAVAAASEQATSNVQTVAVATEELSASVREIGRQMEQSTRIAGQAVSEAEATSTAMLGLAEMARKVDNVVQIISEIASQTNLLALNATIEAARAGEAGKGFAVVASEVKALANRTAKATEEISQQIRDMQAETASSVTRIETIGQTIGEMSRIATAIASAVEEQGAATQEIARSVQEAAKGTGEVSSNIAGVAQAAGETGAAAAQVKATSGEVAKQGEGLNRDVGRFLEEIRAA